MKNIFNQIMELRSAESNLEKLHHEVDGLMAVQRLRRWYDDTDKAAATIPPMGEDEMLSIIRSNSPMQFESRRTADRYLLAFCLSLLALVVFVLWHMWATDATFAKLALLLIAAVDLWTAQRSALSLYLMWQCHRLRSRPYRMARYAERLKKLTIRRQWLGRVQYFWYSQPTPADEKHLELKLVNKCSYCIAACLVLLIVLNAGIAFAAPCQYSLLSAPSNMSAVGVCDNIMTMINGYGTTV